MINTLRALLMTISVKPARKCTNRPVFDSAAGFNGIKHKKAGTKVIAHIHATNKSKAVRLLRY